MCLCIYRRKINRILLRFPLNNTKCSWRNVNWGNNLMLRLHFPVYLHTLHVPLIGLLNLRAQIPSPLLLNQKDFRKCNLDSRQSNFSLVTPNFCMIVLDRNSSQTMLTVWERKIKECYHSCIIILQGRRRRLWSIRLYEKGSIFYDVSICMKWFPVL